MRNFVLYLDLDNHLIPVGSSSTSEFKEFSTYNENLDEAENDQYTLTFSIVAKSYTDDKIQWNPLLSFYHMGAKMRLLIDGHKRIDLIIKGVAPKTNQLNTEWNITAQDEVSYLWSKQHITQVYSTTDGNTDILKPKNIYDICDELIVQNYLEPWQATRLSRDPELAEKTITLDNVQNNPYQILIEACNTVGANMSIDYANHTIDFYRKNLVRYSGYRYHPARNLEVYDVDYSGEETTTWLHVHGGEDANGMTVTMIPALPAPVRQYIKNNISQIDAVTWTDIYNTIGYKIDEDYIDTYILSQLVDQYIDYSLVHIDKIQVNGTTYTHGNVDIDLNVFGQDEVNKKNYVKFFINENTSYTVFLNSNPNLGMSETQIEAKAADGSDITIFRTQQSLDIYHDEYTKTLKQELLTFARIGKEIPYLGQYLIDFKPFKHSMTKEYWDYLQELINTTLFHYNLKLQYYSSEYYSNLIQLIESRNYLEKVLGERYLAACSAYIKDDNPNNLNDIEKYKAEIKNYIENSSYINSIQNLGLTSVLEIDQDGLLYWRNLIQKQKDLINSFIIEQNNIRKLSSDSNGMIEYYNKLIQQSTMLITDNIIPNSATVHKGLYPLIIDYIINYIKNNPDEIIINNGIAKQYEDVQTAITNNVFKTLYSKYGQYLYENTYENAEELDSISLYNQAITYFADLNRIQSSHSLTVLDIGSLDAIAVPRLSVGSVISVYNPDTPTMQPYAPLLEKVEISKQKYNNLKNWTTYINDANLHKALINQAHAEYINATEVVIEKYNINNPTKILDNFTELENLLYQDTVIVTGISRVLREPLRDSVTVEQSSRYKSILAKLIKSI